MGFFARLILLILALTILGEGLQAAEKPLKVIVCAGQSNMVGKRSRVNELPPALQGPQKNLIYHGGEWLPLTPGLYQGEGFGPEVSFAAAMSKALGEPVGIIKHAVGSTGMGAWSPVNESSHYWELKNMVQQAQKGRRIKIIAMLWMQGETDAKGSKGEGYQKGLVRLIDYSRKDFKSPSMWFIAGRINPGPAKFSTKDQIRLAIETCPAKGYAYVDCDALEKNKDDLHYNTAGIVGLGFLYAEKLTKALKIKR